jgi:hypothetical protein
MRGAFVDQGGLFSYIAPEEPKMIAPSRGRWWPIRSPRGR